MKMTKKTKIALSSGAITALVILGACGDSVTQVTNVGIDSVASYKDLPECNDRNDGEPYYVKDSSSMYLCTGNSWKKMNGETGATGKDGSSCSVSALENGSGYEVLCGGKKVATLLNGAKGETGASGKSAYEIAKAGGYKGTEAEWLESLKGATGVSGSNGKSAYEIAKDGGYTGTQEEWLESLKGVKGTSCTAAASSEGIVVSCGGEYVGTLTDGANGAPGENGTSCNAAASTDGIVVSCGGEYVGTLMNGTNGAPGENCTIEEFSVGAKITCDNKSVTITNGTDCTGETLDDATIQITCGKTFVGVLRNGKSAYEIALEYGFVGTEQQWIESLKGTNGTSCSGKAVEGGIEITCGGSVVGTLTNGGKGDKGDDCSGAQQDDGSIVISCGGVPVGTLAKGNKGDKGDNCTVTSTSSGATIQCGDGTSVAISNGSNGSNGTNGTDGKSAYELAVEKGYTGTLDEWLASLKGTNGSNGSNGTNGYNCSVTPGENGVYNLTCEGNTETYSIYKAVCGSTPYDPDEKFCFGNQIYARCGSSKLTYNPRKQTCDEGVLKNYCGTTTQTYVDADNKYCDNGTLKSKPQCGTTYYDPREKFCISSSLHDKCGGKTFNPSSQFCDVRDNRVYKMVTIGTGGNAQVWMAENLNYETAEGSSCYNFDNDKCDKYGRLYTWVAACGGTACNQGVEKVRGICPDGWHLPSGGFNKDNGAVLAGDFKTLVENANGGNVTWTTTTYSSGYIYAEGKGTALKTSSGWNSGAAAGTGDYGFAALPGGYRSTDGTTFTNVGNNATFWSSSENDGTHAYNLNLYYNNTNAALHRNNKAYGFSVRCLKD